MTFLDELRKIFLFSELEDSELEQILSFSKIKTFSKGEIIFFDTEPYIGFYGIINGQVKIYKISQEGREHIIHLENTGSTFAEIPMFEKYLVTAKSTSCYPANAMSIEDCTKLIRVPELEFLNFICENPKICMKMLCSFARRLKFLNSHIGSIILDDVTKRLLKYIVKKCECECMDNNIINKCNECTIELDISKSDLASHLGTITETLSRSFKKLQNENVISVKGKFITIKNLTYIKKIIK